MRQERKLHGSLLILYCVVLFILWSIIEIILFPIMENTMDVWAEILKETAVKLLIWTLPVILLIRFFEKDMWLSLKKMFTNKVNWWPYIAIVAGVFILRIITAYRSFGRIGIHSEFQATSLVSIVMFVGITEEVVFRGWLLNAAVRKWKYWPSLCTNSALFVLIHFPIWIRSEQFNDLTTVLGNCASIFVVSVLFSWAFIKSKNLIIPIVLHMAWNLSIILFLGG